MTFLDRSPDDEGAFVIPTNGVDVGMFLNN